MREKITLEDLGWVLNTQISDLEYLRYERDGAILYIDLDKKSIYVNGGDDPFTPLSFATLEAIRDIVIENAIY